MRRICALVVVLVAWGMLAASAGASVESKRVKQSRDEVVSYWTPERMRNAKPADRVIGGKPTAYAKGGKNAAGSATEVTTPYTDAPTSTNGKVFFTENNVNYVCSGTALTSANQSVVWTAGHCVNEGPGDFVTNWSFVPAYKDGQRPRGTFAAKSLHTTTQWATSGNFSYDLGAAVVYKPSANATLSTTVGGRTPAFGGARDQPYDAYGYPAASPFNGQRLWYCPASGLYMSDGGGNGDPQTMGIQCNMTGGSSGGGWIGRDGRLYSVNSYGYNSLRNVMFGPFQGSVASDLYNTAQNSPTS